jgi:hypothetical protein
MSNGRAQVGGNGAGPSAFSMYASRFLNGNGRETEVEGSQVSILPYHLSPFLVVSKCPSHCSREMEIALCALSPTILV